MHHFQGKFGGGPPYFGDMESCPHGFGNYLLLLIYVCMLLDHSFFSMSCFNVHYAICHDNQISDMHDQYLRSPMFIQIHILCSHICLAIVYIIDLCMCMYIMIICMFMRFVLISMLHVFDYMFRCQFSLKLGYILVQLVSYKQTIICLCLNAHLYLLDVLVQPSFDDSNILTCIPILYMFFMFMFNFMYMSILSKLITIHIHP